MTSANFLLSGFGKRLELRLEYMLEYRAELFTMVDKLGPTIAMRMPSRGGPLLISGQFLVTHKLRKVGLMSVNPSEEPSPKPKTPYGQWGAGMAIGLVIGVVLGIVMKNLSIGIGTGIALGVAFAIAFDAAGKRSK